MNYTLKDLLDVSRLQSLLDSLDEISSMPSAILDAEGNILVASAWQDICVKFHRINPNTLKRCLESDLSIEVGLADKVSYTSYHCPMGLIDAAMSIVIEERPLGKVFVGQFFLEPPDEAYFIKQAGQYGFDEREYLEAMRKVPVFSEEQLHKNLSFIGKLAQMLAEQGLQNRRQIEAEEALRKSETTASKLKDTLQEQYEELQMNEESLREQNDELLSAEEMLRVQIEEYETSQKLLKESEERFKALHEATFGGIIIHDKGLILDCNQGLSDMTGFTIDELIGMNGLKLIAPEWLDLVVKNIQGGYEKSYEVEGVRKDGSKYHLAIRGKNIPYKHQHARVIEFRDITDRKHAEEQRLKLEQQLLHAQKLESLGVLAGGIAHDFNNILMAIIGNADLALMRISKESPAVENLRRIEQAAARAADLAKQMLAYSGKGKFVIEHIDLNVLLEEMLRMLEVSISKKAVLRLNTFLPLPSVEADATQMRQIIMNLVINASEAIGEKSGVIAITTGCMDCDRSYLKDVWLDENLIDGLYVYLEIADSGCGMDKETMAKLFDPFFTTKFTGRGLGMAAVLGIVRGHKGAIKVYSELKKGTSFKILLPASSRPAEIFNGSSDADNWKGYGTVLLVDDEETVRGIGVEMLKELGFTTITAGDGKEAVALFKQNLDINFVILDLTMPHMDGEQCFRELKQLKPGVKVIISSGYNEQEVTQKFVGKGLAGFIQKPYKLSVLRESIKALLKGV